MKWRALAVALVCGLVFAAPQGWAAEYPTRAIKLVVPYPAGGPTDVLGRMVGEYLSRDLKQTVVIENKGGAQGAIGADAVAHAEADGYTLLFTASSRKSWCSRRARWQVCRTGCATARSPRALRPSC